MGFNLSKCKCKDVYESVEFGSHRILQISCGFPQRSGQLQVLVGHGVDAVVVGGQLLANANTFLVQTESLERNEKCRYTSSQ